MGLEQKIEMFGKEGLQLSPEERQFLSFADQWPESGVAAVSALYSSRLIEKAFAQHAIALGKSAEASDKHARALVTLAEASERHAHNLTRATWVLAFATIGLFIATALLVVTTLYRY